MATKQIDQIVGRVQDGAGAVKNFLLSKLDNGQEVLGEIMRAMAARIDKKVSVGLEKNEAFREQQKAKVANAQGFRQNSTEESKTVQQEATSTKGLRK